MQQAKNKLFSYNNNKIIKQPIKYTLKSLQDTPET